MTGVEPEVIGQGIVDLTNETFDRVQAHVVRYALDERREPDNGVTLSSHISTFFDADNHYGFLDLKVCNAESRRNALKLFMGSSTVAQYVKDPERTHGQVFTEVGEEKQRIIGASLGFFLLRDRHPQGHVDHRINKGEYWGNDDFNPDVWGERHKVGTKVELLFEDPDEVQRLWTMEFQLQDRFDRPNPQRRIISELKTATPDTPEVETDEKDSFGDATDSDLTVLQHTLAVARDIRPVVDRIDRHVRYRQFVRNMWARLDEPETVTSEAVA